MTAFKMILVPTDFSPASAEAFRVAVGLAATGGGEVVVVHVARDVAVIENGPATAGRFAGKNHNLWDDFRTMVTNEPNVRVTHELVAGRIAATEIVVLTERFGCDLIVLGSHGHGRLRRLLHGSLTDEVVRRARCPVLVVKAPVVRGPAAKAMKAVPAQSGRTT